MNFSLRYFSPTAALVLPLLLSTCGGNGAKTGTQTGDEGGKPPTTATVSAESGGSTASGTSMGGATADGTATDGANTATTGDPESSSNSSSDTSAGGSGSGADTTAATSAGGGGGESTDGQQSTNTTGGGTMGSECTSDDDCDFGISCCEGTCVNLGNDIRNCGACGVVCEGDLPFCLGNTCGDAPCSGAACGGGESCCGSECCGAGELCCAVNLGPTVLGCFEPVNGTCPMGCPACDCAAPDTPIATPSGERPIASLRVGDLVYSTDEYGIVVVPIVEVNRVSVENHVVVHVTLDDGGELRISPRHPLFGSGVFGDLATGARLGERTVLSAKLISYDLPFTHDILPGSSTGAYFAAGVLIGSTLAR